MVEDLVPPQEILAATSDGTPREQYKAYGEGFVHQYLIGRGRLQSHERVLEVGSGNGQKARVLTSHLNERGSYEGIDIILAGVEWCQRHYARFTNFRFQRADLYNDMYNPQGALRDHEYEFPFSDDYFDFVFLSSVFTHMLPNGIARYIQEIARVLKPGGRCVATFFLLNEDALHWTEVARPVFNFPFKFDGYRLQNRDMVGDAVAVEEKWVRDRLVKSRLRVAEITYGHWCGATELIGGMQDTIISIKM